MIFWKGTPRRVKPAEAERIAAAFKRADVEICGVFVNSTLDEVARMADRVGLTMLQFHGEEGPAYCAEAHRRTGARVIKAKAVGDRGDVQALDAFRDIDYHLIDARVPGMRGGTGQTVDVELVRARRSPIPLILAGGLNPDNVAGAAAAVHPFAVDTASGTEARPGVKDPEKLRAFAAAVASTAPAVAETA